MKRLEYKMIAKAPWMILGDIRYSIVKAFSHRSDSTAKKER
jgi:hypothetical protein